jgi:hypothetical protein
VPAGSVIEHDASRGTLTTDGLPDGAARLVGAFAPVGASKYEKAPSREWGGGEAGIVPDAKFRDQGSRLFSQLRSAVRVTANNSRISSRWFNQGGFHPNARA